MEIKLPVGAWNVSEYLALVTGQDSKAIQDKLMAQSCGRIFAATLINEQKIDPFILVVLILSDIVLEKHFKFVL